MPIAITQYPPTIKKGDQKEAALRPMGSVKQSAIKPAARVATPIAMTFFPGAEIGSRGGSGAGAAPRDCLFFFPMPLDDT